MECTTYPLFLRTCGVFLQSKMNQLKTARFAVNCLFALKGFSYANWMSRLPQFQKEYDMGDSTLGLVLLCHAIGALIAMPITGRLIAKFGSQTTSTISGLTFVVLGPLLPLMPNVTLLGLIFGIIGMSSGMLDVSINDQAVLIERGYRKPIMSSFHAVYSAGMMVGAGGGILAIQFDLSLFHHLIIIGLFGLLLVLWSKSRLIVQDSEIDLTDHPLFYWPKRSLVIVGIIAFCCMLGEGSMVDWSTIFMEEFTAATPQIAPFGLAAFATAMMVIRLLGDRIRVLLGDHKFLISSSVVAVIGLGMVLAFPKIILSVLGFSLVGAGVATIVPIAYSIAGNTPNVSPGVGISMVTTIGYSGFLFGPPIIGFIAEWYSLRVGLLFVLLLFFIMLFLSWYRLRIQEA